MRHSRFVTTGVLMALAAVLAGSPVPSGAQTPAPYVHVMVDSQPVDFDVPPQIASGRVLVPLRGVFERLGATVAWDEPSRTVQAQRGPTGVSLVIGSQQATIDGRSVGVDVPAMIVAGRTMVPLRFVSQALGAGVNWDAASTTVTITSGAANLPPSQRYGPPAAGQHVVGTLVALRLPVDPGSPGQVVVRHDGIVSSFTVTPATVITRINTANGGGGSVALGELRRGDRVDIMLGSDNTARRIRATYYAQ